MKKLLIIVIAVVVLVVCLAVARWADQNTKVPAPNPSSTAGTTTAATGPSSSTAAQTPGDIDNGLGWG